jgi:L-alanine-DL-glutamate epimerase-like enolase superfamily enzyme
VTLCVIEKLRGKLMPAVGPIVSVKTRALRVPVREATSFSTRTVYQRDYLLVELAAADGVSGHGYTYVGTTGGLWLKQAIDELIAPHLLGRNPLAFEQNWRALYGQLLLLGRRGALLRAISAVDIAAWDLMGQAAGLPLFRLLGGTKAAIPAYASGGYYRAGNAAENVAQEIERYRQLGFSDFKIKVGGAPLKVDVARVATARDVIGPTGRLALDANNAWACTSQALEAAKAFEPHNIWWLEEPLTPDDVRGHAELVQTSPIPIATGEIEATHWGFEQLLSQNAANILQPDAGVLGGITEWLLVVKATAAAQVPIAPHWHANLHAHLASAAANCLAVEYFALAEDIYNFEALVTEPLTVSAGEILLRDDSGLGVTFNPEALARYDLEKQT